MHFTDTRREPRTKLAPTKVVIVSTQDEAGATARLMSIPLHRGLTQRGIGSLYIRPDLARTSLDYADCVIFHYEDLAAIEVIRAAYKDGMRATIVCLGSDIYSFDKYISVHDLVSFYLVPTDMHKMILSSQLNKPVYLFPEAFDQAAAELPHSLTFKPQNSSTRRVCWFGYSTSFDKGMASLIPVIRKALLSTKIDCFDAVLDQDRFVNNFGVITKPYSHTAFSRIAADYDYVVLSHFSLDLDINSIIKSPNKAISSLIAGMIPLASDTPSYGKLFRELGLERFLFSSPYELSALFDRLNPTEDLQLIRKLGVVESLLARFSEDAHTERFLDIYDDATSTERPLDFEIVTLPLRPPPEYTLTWLLRGLGPSAARMVRAKTRKLGKRWITKA